MLLLAQVVLMARVPLLERAFGQDRLARLHRLVGFTSFNLMVVHVVTITWGYAAGRLAGDARRALAADRRLPGHAAGRRRHRCAWSWSWSPASRRPGGGCATSPGTCCTCTPTSASAWRCRTSCGPARSSSASTGRDRVLVDGVGAAAAAVLVWRVGLPLLRNLRHRLRVTSVVARAPASWSVYLTGRRLDRLPGRGRPVLHLALPRPARAGPARNPYSLSAAPDGRSLRITSRASATGASRPARLRPGTRVLVEGPYGRLTARARTRRKVALIGAGVGITPLRALAEGLDVRTRRGDPVERFSRQPLFAARGRPALPASAGCRCCASPDADAHPGSWLGDWATAAAVDDLGALRHWVPDMAERDVYLCGPEPWTALVRRTLEAAGVPADQIHLETFAW